MKPGLIVAATVLVAGAAAAVARPSRSDYPSCDLRAQRAVTGELGESITDKRQAHISVRANILQADIGNASVAGRVGKAEAERLWQRVQAIRQDADADTRRKGFLSAGERASDDRALDAIAERICR